MKEKELLEVLSSFNDVYLSGFGGEVEIEPLDGLYGEIEREYLDYFSKNEKFAEEHDGNVFMCDRFSNSTKIQRSGFCGTETITTLKFCRT